MPFDFPDVIEREEGFDPDKIVQHEPYGRHIGLTCRNHPNLRWHTKNISPIGARHIFFVDSQVNSVTGELIFHKECDCPLSDLIPL